MKLRSSSNSHSRGFLRDSFWSTATTAASVGLQMLEIIILSRALPPATLGAYFLVTAFPELIQGLLDLRLQEVMIKYLITFLKAGDADRVSALVKVTWLVSFATGLLLLLIVAGTSSFASSLLGIGTDVNLMLLYSVGLFSVALQGRSGAIIRALGRFKLNFWVALTEGLVRFLFILIAVTLPWGLTAVIAARVLGQFAGTVIIGVTSFSLLRARVKLNFFVPLSLLRPLWKELAVFSFHLNLASIAKGVAQKMDTLLVGALLTPGAVAAYKVVGQLGKSVYLLSDPLMTAAYPRFVDLVSSGNLKEVRRLAWRASIGVALALAPVLLISSIFSRQLVTLFAGSQYTAYGWLLPYFMWTCAPAVIIFWTHPYLLSIGWAHANARANVAGRTLGILIMVVLLNVFSLPGAAIGSGMPQCFTVVLGLAYVWRQSRHVLPSAMESTAPSLE